MASEVFAFKRVYTMNYPENKKSYNQTIPGILIQTKSSGK